MHDLVHDLAKSIMVEECHLIEDSGKIEASRKVRHVAFSHPNRANIPGKDIVQSLRSFIVLSNYGFESKLHVNIFKHLRALKILHFSLTSIGNLKHLRYLDFSGSFVKTLPESISCLNNLQTLNLRNCVFLERLPKHINHLKNLLYLEISGCNSLRSMPKGMRQLTCLRKLSMFIVGEGKGCQLEELKELKLGGELKIKNLDNVKRFTDARSANLMMKKDLRSLSLCWGKNNNSNVEEVINGLEPYSDLKRLEIDGYEGSNFAEWMMRLSLPNLVEITLIDFPRCEHLPPFGRLQFLKKFSLKRMYAVKYIDNDMNGKHGEISFPSLEELSLDSMGNLEKWATSTCGINICPRLTQVKVAQCSKFVELPHFTSVENLTVGKSSGMLLSSVVNFNTLKYLCIEGIFDLTVFPDGMMTNLIALENLEIRLMPSLKSLSGQLDNLSALKFLRLFYCAQLESFWDGLCNLKSLETVNIVNCGIVSFPNNGLCDLSSLCRLNIEGCSEFASLSGELRYLLALKELNIRGCPKLNSLPESVQYLTALQRLEIYHCEGLSCLPDQIRHLASLSSLRIRYCRNLTSLPDGMENLKALTYLSICECPHIKKRCKKNKGEDWPKIAHIPDIDIS